MKLLRRKEREKKRASANNKGADQSARTRRLICAFVFAYVLKRVFSAAHMETNHRSSTNRTIFWLVSIQWRTNIHTWSTFLRGLIQNSVEVKATVSKTARRNEE